MNNKVFLKYFLIMVVITACKVGKNYQRPQLSLPTQFRGGTFSDTSSIANIEWNKFFADTTLQGLISRGIIYNYDLQIAIKRIDEARQRVKQARLLQLPELSIQVSAQTTNPSNNGLNGLSTNSFVGKSHIEDYTAGLFLSWEADIWGKIRRQKEATVAQYLQTQEAAKAVQTQLVSNIAQGFYNLLMLDAQLEIAQKNLKLNDSILLFTRFQRDAGEVTTLAVEQAEAQMQSTALLIPQFQENIVVQENALSVLIGVIPDSIRRQVKLREFSVPENPGSGIPSAIISRRPDVRASEMALIAANAQAGVAQGSMYPSFNITAGGGLNSFLASNWFKIPSSLFGTAAGNLTQPIFQRRRLKTDFEVAKIQREEAVILFKQSVLNAVGEVADALVRTNKLQQQQQIATAQVDTLILAVKNARLLFKSGMANYLEVIIAQENALQAELNLASIERQQLSSIVDLYRSLGGGWSAPAP